MSERVRVEVRGRHARLTFDDGRMNLLSHDGLDAISGALDALLVLIREKPGEEPAVVTFESGREGLFAAGADMREMTDFDPYQAAEFSRKGQELFGRLARFPALTTVVVEGDCFGGALDFLMAFDLRIATPAARFSHPGGRIGIVTGFGGTASWRSAARPGAAGDLFLGNLIIDAERARQLRIVHAVTDQTDQLLRRIVSRSRRPTSLPDLKRLAASGKNLRSLTLLAKRLDALRSSAAPAGRTTLDGHSRDTSRHLFG